MISHTSFTKSDSMGSTLASYFTGYDSDRLAQFYIKDMTPDMPVCKNYYRVTDREVFKAALFTFSCRPVGGRIEPDFSGKQSSAAKKDTKSGNSKNRALRMIVRNTVWNLSRFTKKGFQKWVDEFSPDAVLVQPGDFGYILKLATKISKKRRIPLIIHQSESYYLKPYYSKRLSYLLYRLNFKRNFEKMMKRASACIYLCDALQRDYGKIFDVPSVTIYKSTDIIPKAHEVADTNNGFRCIYGGNLGEAVGRAEPLCEIGKAIKKCGGVIDVYTSSKGEHLRELNDENGIVLHGAVSSDELIKKTQHSDFVLHIENQSKEHITDLEYAFSTKIADMLACGRPAIIYGSAEIAGIKYFADNDLGLVIEKKEDLYPEIKNLVDDPERQNEYVGRAIKFAKENHDPKKNSEKTKKLIKKVCEK
ncbi:MAG: hypothetical protein J5766_05435 [Clostridia bacterium]|nr:hypothetical protein [Clostridia bacterium]